VDTKTKLLEIKKLNVALDKGLLSAEQHKALSDAMRRSDNEYHKKKIETGFDSRSAHRLQESDMSEPSTPIGYLARAGKSFAKGIGIVFAAIVALFSLIWIGGSDAGGGPVKLLLVLMILIPIYFLPSFAAKSRRHSKQKAIFLLNLLLGWSLLGWVVALVWAYTENNTGP
jgi:hypothetical protein